MRGGGPGHGSLNPTAQGICRERGTANRPRVMAPLLPAKNRPISRGSDKQGVTPTIRLGVLRGCPSTISLLTQPLNQGLLINICGGTDGWTWDQVQGVLRRVGWAGTGQGMRGRGSSHWELGAVDRKTPHKERVGLGAFCPLILLARLLARLLLALSPDSVHLQLDPSPRPSHRHLGGWGGEEAHQAGARRAPPTSLLFSPSPCATGQLLNAGDSGRGARALGLVSEPQSICGSGRAPGRGCPPPGAQRGAGVLFGCEGGPPWRSGTWKPAARWVSAWAALTPPLPGLVLPVLKGRQDGCELQVTGQGTSKLVGAVDGPKGPRRRAGRVLGGLPGVPGDLWGQMGMQGC